MSLRRDAVASAQAVNAVLDTRAPEGAKKPAAGPRRRPGFVDAELPRLQEHSKKAFNDTVSMKGMKDIKQ
ncbi:MAG: hypothetical protein GEU82_08910 [Luteitalea sp.]|nr:hypothetical protein [Luteitalea sp.]